MSSTEQSGQDAGGVAQASDTLTITDNRTGRTYELPITDGTVRAMDFRQMKSGEDDFGLMTYDPAFTNTASCRSAITYLDGEAGVVDGKTRLVTVALDLAEVRRPDGAVDDRELELLPGPVVPDGEGLRVGHSGS